MQDSRMQTSMARAPGGGGRIGPGPLEGVAWTGLYLVLAALPLGAALIPPAPPSRGLWIELGVAFGFIALAMFGLQFALTARFRRIASPYGLDTQLHFHRQAGLIATFLALAHPVVLIAAQPSFAVFLDPRESFVRAAALWVLLASLLGLVGITLWRTRVGLAYNWWRAAHGVLATAVVFIGLIHVLRVGHYVGTPGKQALWVAASGGAILLLVVARVLRPLHLRRKPYRVVDVRRERASSWTLTVEPDGHEGLRFEAGQFAWLTLGASPFALEQHPFSFSSSAETPGRLEFTVKELGDFTSMIGSVEPGTRAFLEGPYGAFTLDSDAEGAVFIAGGVGITPVISILRTLADRNDPRPLRLVYGSQRWEDILFREELEALAARLDLEVEHVLGDADPEWSGESGLVDEAMLRRCVSTDRSTWEYFVCGPGPMMDVVEPWLLENGVPMRRVNSERFNIA